MKVKRNERIFNVIEHLPDYKEVCVEDEFDFAEKPYKRTLKIWWSLEYCDIVEH